MWKIYLYITRFCEYRDPLECFREKFCLKALPLQQTQWIRRQVTEVKFRQNLLQVYYIST